MARVANPTYSSPYPTNPAFAAIGSNLATALFGDPEMRAQSLLRRAQMGQANAAAAYDQARTTTEGMAQQGMREQHDLIPSLYGDATVPDFTPPAPVGAPPIDAARAPVAVTQDTGGNQHLGPLPGDPRSLALALFPQAHVTSGTRTQAQQDALVASGATKAHNSLHVAGRAVDMAPIPGMTLADAVTNFRNRGVNVTEALNESGHGPNQGTGPHWHIGWSGVGQPGTAHPQAGGEVPAVANLPATPPMLAEPGGHVLDPHALAGIVAAAALTGKDPRPMLSALSAMLGGDAGGRAALEMNGQGPGKDFAASREAQVNNSSRDQFSDLAKTVIPKNIESETSINDNVRDNATSRANNAATNATSIQTTNITQAGENSRSAANIAAENARAEAEIRAGKFRDKTHETKPVSTNQLANVDSEIDVQIGADKAHQAQTGSSIDPEAKTAVRKRAIDLINGGANPADAVQRALHEMTTRHDMEAGGKVVGGHYYARQDKPQNKTVQTPAKVEKWSRDKSGKLVRVS